MSKIATYEEFYRITSRAILKLPINLEEITDSDPATILNLRLIDAFEQYTEALTVALSDFDGKMRRS